MVFHTKSKVAIGFFLTFVSATICDWFHMNALLAVFLAAGVFGCISAVVIGVTEVRADLYQLLQSSVHRAKIIDRGALTTYLLSLIGLLVTLVIEIELFASSSILSPFVIGLAAIFLEIPIFFNVLIVVSMILQITISRSNRL